MSIASRGIKKIFLLFTFFSITFLDAAANRLTETAASTSQTKSAIESSQLSEEEKKLLTDALPKIYLRAKENLNLLIKTVESFITHVKKDHIIVKNKDEFKSYCTALIKFINNVQDSFSTNIDLRSIDQLLFFTFDLTCYFAQSIDSNDSEPLQFDPQKTFYYYEEYLHNKLKDIAINNPSIGEQITELENTCTENTKIIEELRINIRRLKKATKIYIAAKEQLNILIQILNSVNLNIKNNNITIENKTEFQENCSQIISIATYLRGTLPSNLDLDALTHLQFFIVEVANHCVHAFKGKKIHLTPFDLKVMSDKFNIFIEKKITHIHKNQLDINELISDAQKTQENNCRIITGLQKQTSELGLTAVNKVYRKINERLIQPCLKNKYHIKVPVALASLYLSLLIYRYLDPSPNNLIDKLYKSIPENPNSSDANLDGTDSNNIVHEIPKIYENKGWFFSFARGICWPFNGKVTLSTTDTADNVNDKRPLAPIAHVHRVCASITHGEAAVLATFGPYCLDFLKTQFAYPAMDKMYEWGLNAHYRLLGGSYTKRMQELKDAFLIPRITFDNVVGNEHAKLELRHFVDFMRNPEFYLQNSVAPLKGIILTGLTGTGKSYIVEALAGEIKQMLKETGKDPEQFKFFPVPNKYFRSTEKLQELFDIARFYAPCILFVDEIDMYNLTRTGNSQLLQQLLIEMSGSLDSDPDKVIIMIAATNDGDALDEALVRAGRLERPIEIKLPGFNDRKEFFRRGLTGLVTADPIDLDRLSHLTEGQTYSAIGNVIGASSFATIVYHKTFSQELLEQNIDRLLHNVESIDSKDLPTDEKELIATHQAGHALAMMLLSPKTILDKVHIRPYLVGKATTLLLKNKHAKDPQHSSRYGKILYHREKDTHGINSYDEQIKQCKIALAGNAAERLIYGNCSNTYQSEYTPDYAFKIALTIASQGLNLDQLTPVLKTKYEEQAIELFKQCEQEAYELLSANKELLGKIIAKLLKQEQLTRTELSTIIDAQADESPKKISAPVDPLDELPT